MDRLRVALLNASHSPGDTRRNFRRELDADLVEFDVAGGVLPEETGFDAVVVTGSSSSVYWDEPWIEETTEWVRGAVDRGTPVLGVCFGHQLVASAIGGTVEDMGEYELGYREITHDGGPLFEGVEETFLAFTTHSDTVASLPESATVLASNDYGVQAFRDGRAFGVQFHPEYDREMAVEVTERKDLPRERIDAVVSEITEEAVAAAAPAALVFENFLAMAREWRAPSPRHQ
ncbi:MAG: type 1 glutamine amidotransferase [Halanaeroarchaeum sp.]